MSEARRKQAKEEGWLSRREFLGKTGLAAGGASLASLALTSACKGVSARVPSSTVPATGSPATTSEQVKPAGETQATPARTTALIYAGNYQPPEAAPPLIAVPGGDSKVATDRLYSIQHIWVKPLSADYVVIGLTDKMQMLISNIDHIVAPMDGDLIVRDQSFCYVEGGKMNVDLTSPISGKVAERNSAVLATNRGLLGPINTDPYGKGWMFVIKLSKPVELNDLISAAEYAELQGKMTTTAQAQDNY